MLAVILTTLSGCGSARQEVMSEHTNLPTTFPEGEQVFLQHCHQCHPGGQAGLGPALNSKPLPEFLIKFQVRRGLGAMPPFPETIISSRELDQLSAYLVALRRSH
jgi:mono/diheme cytochrome c family protein